MAIADQIKIVMASGQMKPGWRCKLVMANMPTVGETAEALAELAYADCKNVTVSLSDHPENQYSISWTMPRDAEGLT